MNENQKPSIKKVHAPLPHFDKDNDYIRILQIKKSMTLHQQKIFDAILSTVQDMHKRGLVDKVINEGDLELDYDIFYGYLMKGSRTTRINRKELKEAMEELTKISFSWDIKNCEKDEVGSFVIFQKGVIDFRTNKVKITFGKDFRTEGLISPSAYTKLAYKYLNQFRSQYARVLYQYFKMLIGGKDKPFRTDITLSIEYLYNLLGINENTNKEYIVRRSSFIKRCVEPAAKEINRYSDIELLYTTIRGRANKIVDIYFEFNINKKIDIAKKVAENVLDSVDNKTTSLFKTDVQTFKEFKKQILDNFSGKDLCNFIDGYLPEVTISLTESGYLFNNNTQKHLDSESAMQFWNWLYKNRDRVDDIKIVDELTILNHNYKNKRFSISQRGYDGVITVISIQKNDGDKYRVDIINDSKEGGSFIATKQQIEDTLKEQV